MSPSEVFRSINAKYPRDAEAVFGGAFILVSTLARFLPEQRFLFSMSARAALLTCYDF